MKALQEQLSAVCSENIDLYRHRKQLISDLEQQRKAAQQDSQRKNEEIASLRAILNKKCQQLQRLADETNKLRKIVGI